MEVNWKHLWESAGDERFIVYGFFLMCSVLCKVSLGLLGSLLVLPLVLNDLQVVCDGD